MATDEPGERDCDSRIVPEVDRRREEIAIALAAILEFRSAGADRAGGTAVGPG